MKQKLLEKLKGYLVVGWFANILVFKSSADPVYITKWEDFLSSPDYPATYPANASLTWIKSVSPGNRVRITIFTLQTTCDTDYLEIRDGDSMTSPLIARYCGEVGYTELTSSGTRVLIHFVSDGVIDGNKRGFQLQHSGDCQVDTNQTSGVITTPNYPNDYPNYMECLWTIQLHPAMQITLECDDIALEYQKDCSFDFLEILAGPSLDSPVLGRYCGVLNYSLTFERQGNMSIRFESDPDKEFGGFRCAYNVFKVRGYWTQWTSWAQTCHSGNQTRSRTCVNPLPESGLELICDDVAGTERRSCLGSSGSLWTGSNPSSASLMPIGMPSTLSSGTISASHYGVTLSLSPPSGAPSSTQFLVALSSIQTDPIVPSSLRSVTPSSSQPRVTLPLSQYRLALPSSQLPITPSLSQLGVTLSSSKFRGTPFTTLSTLQETIQRTRGLGGTTSNASVQILNSSNPFDGIISLTYYTNRATDSTLVETNMMGDQTLLLFLTQSNSPVHKFMSLNSELMADTLEQVGHNRASTSSLRSGNSTSVISSTIFQLHQSAEMSPAVPAMNGNSFRGTVELSTKTSASLQSLLSVTGEIPLSRRVKSLTISLSSTNERSSLSNVSYENSLVTDTLIASLTTINSLHQETKQNTQDISLNGFANIPSQTSLTSITSEATDSTSSISTASISNSHYSEPSSSSDSYYSTTSTIGSTLRGKHIMDVSPSNTIYSSPASYTRLSTEMPIDSSAESHQQHVTSIYKVQATPTGATPMCCRSSRFDDTIMLQAPGQSSHDLSKTITDSLMRTAKGAAYTANTVSRGPTPRRSVRELFTTLQTDSLRTGKETYNTCTEQTHGQNIPNPSTTLQMDAPRTGRGPYSTSLEIARGQNSRKQSTALQMDSLRTVKGTYSVYIDQTHEQNTLEPSSTLQIDSLRIVEGTYSAYIDKTHDQKTLEPSSTLQIDSLRTVEGTYSAYIDKTHDQKTLEPSSTLQIDSLRTVEGTYSAYIDKTHDQNTLEPSSTLQIDSLRTVEGTYSAYIDKTHDQKTRSLSHLILSPQTDSLMIRTVKGTTVFVVSTVQGSFVAVEGLEKSSNFQEQSQVSSFQVQPSFSSLSPTISALHTAPSHPTEDSVTPPSFRFPWHLTPFLVIIFVIIVVLFTYYLRVPDLVDALILAFKEKRRQMNASKADNQSSSLTKGNFSTEGFKTSLFHSYQREVFYKEGLNYAFFEVEATKAIEFSVRLDDDENQSSVSEESVEISFEMEEETFDKKHGHDTLSEMFDPSDTEILRKRNTEENLPTIDTRRNGRIYFHDSPASYEI